MVKVKAHASMQDVTDGRITVWERRANNAIDRYAKEGAKCHRVPEEVLLEMKAYHLLAKQAGRWAGEAHVAAEKIRRAQLAAAGPQPKKRPRCRKRALSMPRKRKRITREHFEEPPGRLCPPPPHRQYVNPMTLFGHRLF